VGSRPDFTLVDAEQTGDVTVTFAASEQKLEQGAAVLTKSHGRKHYGFLLNARYVAPGPL
jgi:hypothetical protein